MLVGILGAALEGCGSEVVPSTGSAEALQSVNDEIAQTMEEKPEEVEQVELSNFAEQAAGKSEFDSFEDLKAALVTGNAYSMNSLYGRAGDVMIITQTAYTGEDGSTWAIEGYVYAEDTDGKVRNIGNVFSSGKKYPIKELQGFLYAADAHEVLKYACDKDTGKIIPMADLNVVTDSIGVDSCIGFLRKENTEADEGEYIDTTMMNDYELVASEYQEAAPLIYTVIK